LAVTATQTNWTEDQKAALDALGIDTDSATEGDLRVFLTYAQRTGLDPFARQIYLIGRRVRDPDGQWRKRWTIQVGIDGFRIVAKRSGKYRGQTPAQWCGPDGQWRDVWLDDGPPAAARAGVLHADFDQPLYAVATWAQYAALNAKGDATGLWPRMGPLMLHKCAEALALRRAFPNDLSGIYIAEEMEQSGPAELPVPPVPRAFDEMLADAIAAETVEQLQAVWREAAACGVLDADVTNHTTGEVSSFRDYIIGLVNDVKTETEPAAADPAIGADSSATPQSDSEQQQREDAARDGELDNRGTDQEIHDAEIVDKDDPWA
jgi:phage recombination protein Bet